MQGRRRAKRIKARRRLFYPCILGGRCNALPPPAQVGGVSDVECPEKGPERRGPNKRAGARGWVYISRLREHRALRGSARTGKRQGRYRGLAVFGDGLGMAGAAAGGPRSGPPPGVLFWAQFGPVAAPKRKRASPFGLALSTESRTASTASAPCRNIYSIAQPFGVVNTFFVWLPLAALAASLPRGTPPPTGGRGVGSACWPGLRHNARAPPRSVWAWA